jgi:hypothetical protein
MMMLKNCNPEIFFLLFENALILSLQFVKINNSWYAPTLSIIKFGFGKNSLCKCFLESYDMPKNQERERERQRETERRKEGRKQYKSICDVCVFEIHTLLLLLLLFLSCSLQAFPSTKARAN